MQNHSTHKRMGGLADIAQASLSVAQRKLETVAHNVANSGTVGYRSRVSFQSVLADTLPGAAPSGDVGAVSEYLSLEPGRLVETGLPLDLALTSPGLFVIARNGEIAYTRQGQFEVREGRLSTPDGFSLQSAGGGDIPLGGEPVEVDGDGVIHQGGRVVARIAVAAVEDPGVLEPLTSTRFHARDVLPEARNVSMRQGMVEAANIDMAAEMTRMMSAVREAETASRIMQAYDTLMGRAISTFEN